MKQPTLFISSMSAYRSALAELKRRRTTVPFRIRFKMRKNCDTQEIERGYEVVMIVNNSEPLFI